MCLIREYKCYKGKESEECCNSRVEEDVKRRTNNIVLIVAIALMIVSLTITTVSDADFVAEVSFASTITSIILSVIAIWMSITGERSTNEIKSKVSDSVERLVRSTSESNELACNLRETLNRQNEAYEVMKIQFENMFDEIKGVKTKMESFDTLFLSSTTKQKSKNTTETMSYVVNVIDGISGKEQKQWLCTAMIKLFERAGKKEKLRVRAAVKELDIDETNENIIYGILTSFYHNGVFYSENIKERVQKEIEKLDIEVE